MALSTLTEIQNNPFLGLADTSRGENLNQTDFLRLLVTQLQQQDPLNPMDSADFSAQLAQFSSLEQLIGINSSMGLLADTQIALGQLSAMSLIGKEVTFQDTLVSVIDGDAGRIEFELAGESATTTLRIYDGSGREIKTVELGGMAAGTQSYDWDGTDNFGITAPNGTYTYEVTAANADGQTVAVTTRTTFLVEGIEFINGQTLLRVNGELIPLTSIVSVANPAPAPDPVDQGSDPPPAEPEDAAAEKPLATLLRWIGIGQ